MCTGTVYYIEPCVLHINKLHSHSFSGPSDNGGPTSSIGRLCLDYFQLRTSQRLSSRLLHKNRYGYDILLISLLPALYRVLESTELKQQTSLFCTAKK